MEERYRVCLERTNPAAFEHFSREKHPGFPALRSALEGFGLRFWLSAFLVATGSRRAGAASLAAE